jgi:hypothetical protein
MKIAAFGSWITTGKPEWISRGERMQFEAACRDVGKALAELGHTIIVGSSRSHTADKHVVDGFLSALNATRSSGHKQKIVVIRPYDQTMDYARLDEDLLRFFEFQECPGLRSDGVKAFAVRMADVVITFGGAEGTYLAGLAALLAKKPLVPVASFGGASRQLFSAFKEFGETMDHLNSFTGPWHPQVLESIIKIGGLRSVQSSVRVLLIHGRSEDWQDLERWLSKELTAEITVMKEEFGDGRTLPEKFEELAEKVDGAIALATPDDLGGLANQTVGNHTPRARENVWIEYGWFWGRLGRKRIMLLHRGDVQVPSDLNGLEYYAYQSNPLEVSESIRKFIQKISSLAELP